jgi:hypothetical protein
VTKLARPNLHALAEELLEAVAQGKPESVELARRLCDAVLGLPLVRAAVALGELLHQGSPLAMVRAVELSEAMLDADGVHRETGVV